MQVNDYNPSYKGNTDLVNAFEWKDFSVSKVNEFMKSKLLYGYRYRGNEPINLSHTTIHLLSIRTTKMNGNGQDLMQSYI